MCCFGFRMALSGAQRNFSVPLKRKIETTQRTLKKTPEVTPRLSFLTAPTTPTKTKLVKDNEQRNFKTPCRRQLLPKKHIKMSFKSPQPDCSQATTPGRTPGQLIAAFRLSLS